MSAFARLLVSISVTVLSLSTFRARLPRYYDGRTWATAFSAGNDALSPH